MKTGNNQGHSLSQQGAWVSFGHPNTTKSPLRTHTFFSELFLKMSFSSISLDFFHLSTTLMILYEDSIPYFNK